MIWEIIWFYVDDYDLTIKSKIMGQYDTREEADKDFLAWIRLGGCGFYRIRKIEEKI